MIPKRDRRKLSVYMPASMLAELKIQGICQERSISWLLQKAWQISREEIGRFPPVPEEARR